MPAKTPGFSLPVIFKPLGRLFNRGHAAAPIGENNEPPAPKIEDIPGMEILPEAAAFAEKIGTRLSPDNPIHTLLYRQSHMTTPRIIKEAYENIEEVLDLLRERLQGQGDMPPLSSPVSKLMGIHWAMEAARFKYHTGRRNRPMAEQIAFAAVSCLGSSLVRLAVAHELGWPVHLVSLPAHAVVRWDDGATRLISDYGHVVENEVYRQELKEPEDMLNDGAYFTNLDRQELEAAYLFEIGSEFSYQATYVLAMQYHKKALELNPKLVGSYMGMTACLMELDDFIGADEVVSRGLSRWPNDVSLLMSKSNVKLKLGDKVEYLAACEQIVRQSIPSSTWFFTFSMAHHRLGNYRQAADLSTQALELTSDPKMKIILHEIRSLSRLRRGRVFGFLRDRAASVFWLLTIHYDLWRKIGRRLIMKKAMRKGM